MSLLEECYVDCPYCGEPISLLVDSSCEEQSYVEDCEVCCQPMVVNVQIDEEGQAIVHVHRDDE